MRTSRHSHTAAGAALLSIVLLTTLFLSSCSPDSRTDGRFGEVLTVRIAVVLPLLQSRLQD